MEHDLPDGGLSGWYTVHDDHVTLEIRLTPGTSHNGIDGVKVLGDGRAVLAVRVRANAEKGKANADLVALVARSLGRPRSACRIVSGTTARRKILKVEGNGQALAAALVKLVGKERDSPR